MREKIGDFTIRIIIDKVGHDPSLPLMNKLATVEVLKIEQEKQQCNCCGGTYADQPPPIYSTKTQVDNASWTTNNLDNLEEALIDATKDLMYQYMHVEGIDHN